MPCKVEGITLIKVFRRKNMKILRNFCKSSSRGGIYILSAVRTPFGLLNGVLSEFSAPQLASFAIKEACQRAAVPPEDLQNIFLGCSSHKDCHEEIIKRTGLAKTIKLSLASAYGMKSVLDGLKFLLNSNSNVCVTGGMESVTHLATTDQFFENFVNHIQEDARKLIKSNAHSLQDLKKHAKQDFNNFMKAKKNRGFSDEILKIDFRKKGKQIVVAEDEILRKQDIAEADSLLATLGDGAAAIILSTEDYFKSNNLVPLAKVISFSEEFVSAGDLASAQLVAIEKALRVAECLSENIARWEIVSVRHDTFLILRNALSMNISQVNKDGGFRYPVGMSSVRAVGHLVHSLSAGELGCAASCDLNGTASAVIVKKLNVKKSSKPQLTLYTKHPCSLCDELKHQLEPFQGRFSLAEVDIESKENEKYKELYQYEIPVLFLDGIFLCKHRLNVEDFSRRLLTSERAA